MLCGIAVGVGGCDGFGKKEKIAGLLWGAEVAGNRRARCLGDFVMGLFYLALGVSNPPMLRS